MLAAKARALHSAGLLDPAALAAAPEDQVRKALARGLPRVLASGGQPRGSAKGAASARAVLGGGATAAMNLRSAKALQAGECLVSIPPIVFGSGSGLNLVLAGSATAAIVCAATRRCRTVVKLTHTRVMRAHFRGPGVWE